MNFTSGTRNEIYEALFNLGKAMTWGDGEQFAYASRRVLEWDAVQKPAFFQSELTENAAPASTTPGKRTWDVTWFLYFDYASDPNDIPTTHVNDMLDAMEEMLKPVLPDPGYMNGRLTLGGKVQHVWIEGAIVKIPGDLDNQGLLMVPLRILVP